MMVSVNPRPAALPALAAEASAAALVWVAVVSAVDRTVALAASSDPLPNRIRLTPDHRLFQVPDWDLGPDWDSDSGSDWDLVSDSVSDSAAASVSRYRLLRPEFLPADHWALVWAAFVYRASTYLRHRPCPEPYC
jgi:hypothetical protein